VRPPSGDGEIDMARKFDPRSGCWKFVETIKESGTDKESKDGAVLPVFDTSDTKMNCGGENMRSAKIRDGRYSTQLVGP
jgi:hypothetical protein